MKNFYRGNNKFSGGRDFKRNDFDRGRRDVSDRKSMTRTTCSECGNSCEVPFVPTGNRPVFCNKCFENKRSPESKNFEGRDSAPRYNKPYENRSEKPSNNDGQFKKQLESIKWKLDKLLKLLTPAVDPTFIPAIVQKEKKKKVVEEVKPKKEKVNIKKKPLKIKDSN